MRIRTILAAAAAPAALAAVLLGTAGHASAATVNQPNPNSVIVVHDQAGLDALGGTINKNVDIAADAQPAAGKDTLWLQGTTINGNLTVEGQLMMTGDTINGNVTESGPGSFLGLTNYASHITGNLTVTGSSGVYQGGPGGRAFGNWTQYNGPSQVDGGFTFTNNTGSLYVAYPMHVSGKFTASGNGPYARADMPQWTWDTSGLTVDGKTSVVPPTYSS
jgi:hypothetical protein